MLLTPESSVQCQKKLGADIIIPLDELLGLHVTPQRLRASFERTHRWEARSLQEHLRNTNGQVYIYICMCVCVCVIVRLFVSVWKG